MSESYLLLEFSEVHGESSVGDLGARKCWRTVGAASSGKKRNRPDQ